jgi:MerR family redox-sensitive transcriptional activator SoxR
MGDLTIGEVARRTGLNPSAIRYYERRRLLPQPPRRAGRRCYDVGTIARLRLIDAGRRAGLPLATIAGLLDAVGGQPQFRAALEQAATDVEARIGRLQRLDAFLRTAEACGCAEPLRCELAAGIEPAGT